MEYLHIFTKFVLSGVLIHSACSFMGQKWGRQYTDIDNIIGGNKVTPIKLISRREESLISCTVECQRLGCIYTHFDAETKVCDGYYGDPSVQGYLWKRECPANYKYNQTYDICYIVHGTSTWTDAKKTCESEGSILFIVNNEPRETFMRQCFKQGIHRFWIGGSDIQKEGEWKWIDGTTVVQKGGFDNHGGNENCMEMVWISDYLYYNDYVCDSYLNFICAH